MTARGGISARAAGTHGRRRFRLCFCALLTAIFMTAQPAVLAGDSGRADGIAGVSMFYNETPYKAGVGPMLIDGRYFIPIELFSCVPYVTLSAVYDENVFVMHSGRTGVEISALCAIDRAWINGEIVPLEMHITNLADGTYIYVDALFFADIMGMTLDVMTMPSGRAALRIADGDSKLGFERYLRASLPSEFGDAAFDEPKKTDRRGISLAFIGINDFTDGVITMLDEMEIPACFFLSEDDITAHPGTVTKLFSHGLSVGIYVDSYDDTAEADRTNALLAEITMHRTHFIRQKGQALPPDAGSGYIACGDAVARAIYESEYGYITASVLSGGGIMTLPQNESTKDLIDYAILIGAEFAGTTFVR